MGRGTKIALGIGGGCLILVLLSLFSFVGCLAVLGSGGEERGGGTPGAGSSPSAKKEAQTPPAVEEPAEEPSAAPDPINLSGNGQTATDPFELETGLAIARMSYQGDRNFIVQILDENGSRAGQSLANMIGSFEGSQAIQTKAGQHILDVQASGPWEITIEQPRYTSALQMTNIEGVGQTATDPFQLSGGLTTFNMTHQGSRNFIVSLLNKDGARVGTGLVNEIGPFEGSKAIRVPKDDIYLLDIQADGPWSIQVE